MAKVTYPLARAIAEFEASHDVDLVAKKDDTLSRVIGKVWPSFMHIWWTTLRLPWWPRPRILYPTIVANPFTHPVILHHELVHVPQVRGGWRLLWSALLVSLLPLPIIFSGRWFLERRPYLVDLRNGVSMDVVVDRLWWRYGLAWPRWLMRRWFRAHLDDD